MAIEDPFSAWRGLSEYSLDDAAALCCGIVPGRLFRPLRERDKAEQEEIAALNGWKRRLADARDALGVTVVRHHPARQVYGATIDGERRLRGTKGAWDEYGKVPRAALVEWLRLQGPLPRFFAEDEQAGPGAPEEKPLGTRERTNLLRIIRALDVMAKLPDKAVGESVELQLKLLGFSSPKDEIASRVVMRARALQPDEKKPCGPPIRQPAGKRARALRPDEKS